MRNKFALGIILFGSLSWVLTMVKSGLLTQWGIGFWGANGHDAIWHLALSNSLVRGSFDAPTYAGIGLQNYHIGFDLLLGILSKLGISSVILYFQILPVVTSLTIGLLTYVFVKNWKKEESVAMWATFFVYFGGSLGWVVTLLRGQGFGGESMFWSQQSVSTLINPPFALSLIILMLGLICLQKFLYFHSLRYLVLTSLLFGILIEVKAYAGVLVIGAYLLTVVYKFFIERERQNLKYFSFSFIVILLVSMFFLRFFIPVSGNVFKFQPFWFLETMLALSDRFYWPKLYEAITNWRSGHVYHKAIVGYGVAFVVFMVGNLGTRLFGVFSGRKISVIDVFLGSIILGGVIAPMFLVQEGTAWNTIQFFYYSIFFLAIYAGVEIGRIFKLLSLKWQKCAFSATVILLTLPTSISTLATVYLPGRPPAILSYDERDALAFLSNKPQGVVLTFPFDAAAAQEAVANPPRPLYLYDSTAYVAAFSNHPTFLEDQVNLTILGYKWAERRTQVEAFYKSHDQQFVRHFLMENNISYIYWVKPQRAVLGETQLGIQNIYENKSVILYMVLK